MGIQAVRLSGWGDSAVMGTEYQGDLLVYH